MSKTPTFTQPPVAILGMSADPAHKGHLKVAEALHDLGYERVILLITPQNPFKRTAQTSFEHRMALARILVGRRQWLELSDAEAWMQVYGEDLRTHAMLTHMRQIYPTTPFTFVMGSDNWQHFHEWGKYRDTLGLCGLLIVPRPGSTRLSNTEAARELAPLQDAETTGVVNQGKWRILDDIPGGPASATQIRRAIAEGKPTPFLTEKQLEYIHIHKLYS
ncbi:MAG: nicotinate (nicotinamide) nucleotide adenylyltransferase [Verrucomicrobiaceae bacterium]|nr:MAG: nicotinate (nicotinamide) nucleotide adenylyltransferase [Verrucomicrobiaceae bacterium]